jgi:hypothetical protein
MKYVTNIWHEDVFLVYFFQFESYFCPLGRGVKKCFYLVNFTAAFSCWAIDLEVASYWLGDVGLRKNFRRLNILNEHVNRVMKREIMSILKFD